MPSPLNEYPHLILSQDARAYLATEILEDVMETEEDRESGFRPSFNEREERRKHFLQYSIYDKHILEHLTKRNWIARIVDEVIKELEYRKEGEDV